MDNRLYGLSATALKYIAIAAMLIDHTALQFVTAGSPLWLIMRLTGRLTAPIMCFFIAEGYRHTRSVRRYLARLLLFALAAHIPFTLFSSGEIAVTPLNMLYTLAMGLLAICAWDRIQGEGARLLCVMGLCVLSLMADWPIFGVLFCLFFFIYRDNPRAWPWFLLGLALINYIPDAIAIAALTGDFKNAFLNNAVQLGTVLSVPLLWRYSGRQGGSVFSKYFFYLFYPLHLLVLLALASVIGT